MSWVIHHIRILRRWHARVGVAAMLYLPVLIFTGWALNHGDDLKLDGREITTPWLMSWYGIHAVAPSHGYALGKAHFAWSGEKWALGNKMLSAAQGEPTGAVESAGIYYIATSSTLYLFQEDGQLLDKLEKLSLPAMPIVALGKADNRIVLKTPAAMYASADGLSWGQVNVKNVAWSAPHELPAGLKHQFAEMLAPGLSLQRILLDIHSGRIFGRYGPLLVDFLGLAVLTLGMSGLWIYWRSVRQGRMRKL
jgi:PepSY-associated TM region